jgi:hypothetical protein
MCVVFVVWVVGKYFLKLSASHVGQLCVVFVFVFKCSASRVGQYVLVVALFSVVGKLCWTICVRLCCFVFVFGRSCCTTVFGCCGFWKCSTSRVGQYVLVLCMCLVVGNPCFVFVLDNCVWCLCLFLNVRQYALVVVLCLVFFKSCWTTCCVVCVFGFVL